MPYKRYDLKNRYNSKGQKVSINTTLNAFLMFAIPVSIILILVIGIMIAVFARFGSLDISKDNIYDVNGYITDKELLCVVNSRNTLSSDYVPKLKEYNSIQVHEAAYDDLLALEEAAKADGVSVFAVKGYVSYEDQADQYQSTLNSLMEEKGYTKTKAESETRKICPKEGCSESQTGLLVTFAADGNQSDFENSDAFIWLNQNAIKYGFILRYPEGEEVETDMNYAPDVYRYVGKEHAINMRSYDMTLEEYNTHYTYD